MLDVRRWELTEPSAAAALVAITRLGLDPSMVNQGGGTLAVGDSRRGGGAPDGDGCEPRPR
ncbi:MAG: hypothetical protein R2695_06185 [Acidimicrobiales bacterium]